MSYEQALNIFYRHKEDPQELNSSNCVNSIGDAIYCNVHIMADE